MNFKLTIQKIYSAVSVQSKARHIFLLLVFLSAAAVSLAQVPVNDEPCQATELTPGATCTYQSFTNVNATGSTGMAVPTCAGYSGGDVWFRAIVPAGGALTFDTQEGTMIDGGMAIYRGNSCTALVLISGACDDNSSDNGNMPKITVTGLIPGSTVYARVWENGNNNNGTFGICVTIPPPAPVNDEPCTAVELATEATCTYHTYTNASATNSTGVPAPVCSGFLGGDVWFRVVVPSLGALVFDTQEGVVTDAGMAIYSGSSCTGLTIIDCFDNNSGSPQMPKLTLGSLTAGDTLWIRFWENGNNNNGTFGICVTLPPPPPVNDGPCTATEIMVGAGCSYQSFSNENALPTSSVPDPGCANYQGNDVWFKAVVPAGGAITFDTQEGDITDGGMAVYSGNCSNLVLLDCDDDGSSNAAMPKLTLGGLTPGDTLWVRIWDNGNFINGSFGICANIPPPPPANDEPCNAIGLAAFSACNFQFFTNENATGTPGVGDPGCGGYQGGDVWFKVVVPAGGALTFDSRDSIMTDGGMAIYRGTCNNLTLIDCNDDSQTSTMPFISAGGLTPGDTIWVRLWEYRGDDNGVFGICVKIPPPAPVNDNPCQAVVLAVGSACTYQSFTNESAISTAGVPDPGCAGYSGADVWFKAVVPAGGAINFDTQEGVMTDGGMAVYSGSCTNLTLINCDDDASANGNMPRLNVNGLTPGDTMWVRVWENGNDNNGTFGICASIPPPAPANDDPCNAVLLMANAACTYQSFTNESATATAGVPDPECAGYAGGDVWFKTIVPAGGILTFDTEDGVVTDGGMTVYRGICNNLTVINCDDDGSSNAAMPQLTLPGLTAGDTLWIRIWENGNNNNGSFGICVRIPPPPPANDEPCNAFDLTPGSACTFQTFTNENATNTAGVTDPGCAGYDGKDVWFRVVVPSGGALTFDSQTGDIADGGMAIYSGSCNNLTLIDCDDDNSENGSMPFITAGGLTPGDTIWIRFWDYFGDEEGTFSICVSIPPPGPVNDGPCGAIALAASASCNYQTFTNENAYGTISVPDPGCGDYQGADVWFKVTAPAAGALNINTAAGTITDAAMAIYSADSCSAPMELIACDDNASSNPGMPYITATGLTPGSTVWIRVWSNGSVFNRGTFSICAVVPPLQPATFSFACTRDTSFECGGGDTCFTLDAIIPDIHALTDRYAINPLSSTGCFNPYIDPGSEGPSTDLLVDDIYSDVINLPFTFPFYGTNYNALVASTNGYISFDAGLAGSNSHWQILEENGDFAFGTSTTATPLDLPSALYDRALIMGPYHDLDPEHYPNRGQRIKYNVTGQAPHRRWILSFYKVPLYTISGAGCDTLVRNTHQVVLYEGTGMVEVFLFDMQNCTQWNQGRALIGMQDFSRTKAIMVPGRKASDAPWGRLGMNESWRFVPIGGPSLFKRVELFDTSGNFLATGDTSFIDSASLKVHFRNLCSLNRLPAGLNTLLVRTVYQKFDDPAQEEVGADTLHIFIPNLKVNFNVTGALCDNGNGSVAIHAISGISPLRFSSDSGITWQSDSVINNLAAGRYYLRVQDNTSCSKDTIVTITAPAALSAAYATTQVHCNGGADGNISVAVSGGTAPYTYSFDNGAYSNSGSASFNAGTHTVSIKDANGCTKDTSILVTEPAVLTAAAITANANCNNPQSGQITINAGGGTGTYSYSIDGASFQQQNIFTKGQGTYTLTVRDANGCTATTTATVGFTFDLTIQGRPDTTICDVRSIRLNTISNAETYSWVPASSLDNATIASPFASPAVTTDYILTATLGDCTLKDTVRIVVTGGPTVFAGNDVAVVKGEDARILASATNAASYSWSPTTYLDNPNSLSPVSIRPQESITYTLTAFNSEGCSRSDEVKITVLPYCIKVKNAFTPNGDGVNDNWMIYDQYDCLANVKVQVFNRYGSRVFESSNYRNDWKGTYGGKSLPDATYYYVIDYTLVTGRVLQLRGDVTILR